MKIVLAQQKLVFDEFHALGEGTDLKIQGSVDLGARNALAVTVAGPIDASLVSLALPDAALTGRITVDVAASGTVDVPALSGTVRIENGKYRLTGLTQILDDIDGVISFHGSRDKKDFDFVGYNSRLDEIQAGMLRILLPRLADWNRARREAAARYVELGLGELVAVPEDEPGHIYHLFVCRSPERDRIRAALAEAGIESAVYYTTPLHLQSALHFLGYEPGSLPVTEEVAADNFSLPLWPGIPAETQERVVDVVRSAVPSTGVGLTEPAGSAGAGFAGAGAG